ncbi:MAG: hypothetical protein JNM56_12185 [Planctomycetia bacterium]|nr:hypothetical protein [Planctomycetia bacterium]
MRPDPAFAGLSKAFWASIRTISQKVGYTVRPKRQAGVRGQAGPIKVPTLAEIQAALEALHLTSHHLIGVDGTATELGKQVVAYFDYRADTLNRIVEPLLMDAAQAQALFKQLSRKRKTSPAMPMNKQSGEMKKPAYFTGIINLLIAANIGKLPCDYNPQELTTVTRNREPFRTLARRIDGAFPGPVNPIAVWEVKEYYYTTTFGSRVADGVYETLLDGMELEELDAALREQPAASDRPTHIQHILMIDAHYTWWVKGRSYLCRIIDMLHMGYVDEVLFGREVKTRLPAIAKSWAAEYQRLKMSSG